MTIPFQTSKSPDQYGFTYYITPEGLCPGISVHTHTSHSEGNKSHAHDILTCWYRLLHAGRVNLSSTSLGMLYACLCKMLSAVDCLHWEQVVPFSRTSGVSLSGLRHAVTRWAQDAYAARSFLRATQDHICQSRCVEDLEVYAYQISPINAYAWHLSFLLSAWCKDYTFLSEYYYQAMARSKCIKNIHKWLTLKVLNFWKFTLK